jgi:hypothetical protein
MFGLKLVVSYNSLGHNFSSFQCAFFLSIYMFKSYAALLKPTYHKYLNSLYLCSEGSTPKVAV